jgi:hypothetical protein
VRSGLLHSGLPQLIFLRSNKTRSFAPLSFSYFYFRAPERKQTRRETNTAAAATGEQCSCVIRSEKSMIGVTAGRNSVFGAFFNEKEKQDNCCCCATVRWSAGNQERYIVLIPRRSLIRVSCDPIQEDSQLNLSDAESHTYTPLCGNFCCHVEYCVVNEMFLQVIDMTSNLWKMCQRYTLLHTFFPLSRVLKFMWKRYGRDFLIMKKERNIILAAISSQIMKNPDYVSFTVSSYCSAFFLQYYLITVSFFWCLCFY